jgi:hypothetical protein
LLSTNRTLSAFLISDYKIKDGGMRDLATVRNVLFIRSFQLRSEEHFERIGIGRLCGAEFDKAFGEEEDRYVMLA